MWRLACGLDRDLSRVRCMTNNTTDATTDACPKCRAPCLTSTGKKSPIHAADARELVADIDISMLDGVSGYEHAPTAACGGCSTWSRAPPSLTLIARALSIRPQNAYPLPRELVNQGVLAAKSEHRLGTLWRSDEILNAIDRFAGRAGRRQPAEPHPAITNGRRRPAPFRSPHHGTRTENHRVRDSDGRARTPNPEVTCIRKCAIRDRANTLLN